MNDKLINLAETKDLDLILRDNSYVIVDFYAEWCPPCKALAPIFAELANSNEDVKFVKIDIEKHENLKDQYKVTSIPTLIYFKKSKEVKKTYGFIAKEELRNHINNMKN